MSHIRTPLVHLFKRKEIKILCENFNPRAKTYIY